MFSTEQRGIAIETFIRFDHSHADAIAELGYPTRHSLGAWYKDYLEHGEVRPPKRRRGPKFTLECFLSIRSDQKYHQELNIPMICFCTSRSRDMASLRT